MHGAVNLLCLSPVCGYICLKHVSDKSADARVLCLTAYFAAKTVNLEIVFWSLIRQIKLLCLCSCLSSCEVFPIPRKPRCIAVNKKTSTLDGEGTWIDKGSSSTVHPCVIKEGFFCENSSLNGRIFLWDTAAPGAWNVRCESRNNLSLSFEF